MSRMAGLSLDERLDRASDGRDEHGGFRHGAISPKFTKSGAVARFFWFGQAPANTDTPIGSLVPSHHGEARAGRLSSAEAFLPPVKSKWVASRDEECLLFKRWR